MVATIFRFLGIQLMLKCLNAKVQAQGASNGLTVPLRSVPTTMLCFASHHDGIVGAVAPTPQWVCLLPISLTGERGRL